jgi:VanZ family protein
MIEFSTRTMTSSMAEIWKQRKLVFGALAAYWITLVVATHYPIEAMPVLFNSQDKALHVLAYGLFTTLLWWALQLGPWRSIPYLGIMVVFVLAVHAAMDEYTQQFFRGRFPDILDYFADMLGVILAIPFADRVWRWLNAPRAMISSKMPT